MAARHLGHEYLTDVLEIQMGESMDLIATQSLLYALLEGGARLGILRTDIDGTVRHIQGGAPPSLVMLDAVPGGAGHSRRLAGELRALFEAAFRVVDQCECGDETSCYGCLRSYGNQFVHDLLNRGAARAVLAKALGHADVSSASVDPLLDQRAVPLVRVALDRGFAQPVVGFELDTIDGWQIEAAWPAHKVAILVDSDPKREAWLAKDSWKAKGVDEWTADSLTQELAAPL